MLGITRPGIETKVRLLAPGIGRAVLITLVALACGELVEERLFDYAVLEPLVLALVIGLAVRALRPPPEVYLPGIGFAAKQLLEFAIVLLGASLNLRALVDAGSQILAAVLISVSLTLCGGGLAGTAGRAGHPAGGPDRGWQCDLRELGDRGGCAGDPRQKAGGGQRDRARRLCLGWEWSSCCPRWCHCSISPMSGTA